MTALQILANEIIRSAHLYNKLRFIELKSKNLLVFCFDINGEED
jgi:hypothetical protein